MNEKHEGIKNLAMQSGVSYEKEGAAPLQGA